jgi:hypothetical protein
VSLTYFERKTDWVNQNRQWVHIIMRITPKMGYPRGLATWSKSGRPPFQQPSKGLVGGFFSNKNKLLDRFQNEFAASRPAIGPDSSIGTTHLTHNHK